MDNEQIDDNDTNSNNANLSCRRFCGTNLKEIETYRINDKIGPALYANQAGNIRTLSISLIHHNYIIKITVPIIILIILNRE